MGYSKSDFNSTVNNDKIEIVKNKTLLFLKKFWHFSLFYGDYLGSLHSRKNSKY